jgi:hypothetical protein
VDDFLKGKAEAMIGLFSYFISEYRKIGEFDIHPVKTRVALLTKMRFCSINKIGHDYINIHLVFTQNHADNLCFYKIDNLGNRFFVHHFKIHSKTDINKEVRKYMALAYEIGNRKHIQTKSIKNKK